jgi:hypothetical protein
MFKYLLILSFVVVFNNPCLGSDFTYTQNENEIISSRVFQKTSNLCKQSVQPHLVESKANTADELLTTLKSNISKVIKADYQSCFSLFNDKARQEIQANLSFMEKMVYPGDLKFIGDLLTNAYDSGDAVKNLKTKGGFRQIDENSPYILINDKGLVIRSKGRDQNMQFGGLNICLYNKERTQECLKLQSKIDEEKENGRKIYRGLLSKPGQHYTCNIQEELCKVAVLKKIDSLTDQERWTYRWVPSHRGQIAPKQNIITKFVGQASWDQYLSFSQTNRLKIDNGIDSYLMDLGHHKFQGKHVRGQKHQFNNERQAKRYEPLLNGESKQVENKSESQPELKRERSNDNSNLYPYPLRKENYSK